MIPLFQDIWWHLVHLLLSAWMNTWKLPEGKDEAVRHLRNAIFMWWVKVMDFHLLSYTFSSCMGTSGHSLSSSLLSADLFFSGLLLFCVPCLIFLLSVSSSHSVAFALYSQSCVSIGLTVPQCHSHIWRKCLIDDWHLCSQWKER